MEPEEILAALEGLKQANKILTEIERDSITCRAIHWPNIIYRLGIAQKGVGRFKAFVEYMERRSLRC